MSKATGSFAFVRVARHFAGSGVALCALALLTLGPATAALGQDWEVTDTQREQKILERLLAILYKDPFNAYAFQQVKARSLMSGGLEGLVERYRSALAQNPSDRSLLVLLGRFESARAEHASALRYLDEAQAQGETSWQLLSLRGQVLAELGELERANADFEAALELAKNTDEQLELLREMGDLALRSGRQQDAIDNYLRIVERRPKDKYLRWELAAIFYEKQLWEQALEQYRAAAELAGRNVEERSRAELEVAGIYQLMQRHDDAIVIFEAIMERTKGTHWLHREARYQWIEAYRTKADPLGLLAKVEATLAKSPKTEWALLLRAQLLDELGRAPESLDAYEAYLAVQSQPEPSVLTNYLRLLRQSGQTERLLERYDAMIRGSKDEAQRLFVVLDLCGHLANGAGTPFEAFAVLREYESLFSEAASLFKLAAAYRSLGSARDVRYRAQALLERVIAAEPDNQGAYLALFESALVTGDEPAAAALVERMLAGSSIQASRVEALAQVYTRLGRHDALRSLYELALRKNPENVDLLFLRATLLNPHEDLNGYLLAWKQILLESDDGSQLSTAAENYSQTLEQNGILGDALSLVERQRDQNPEQWRLSRLLFYLYVRNGQLDDALALLPKLERHLQQGYRLEDHALAQLETRAPKQALRLLRSLVKKRPSLAWRYEIQAAELYWRDRHDEAATVSLLESAIARAPNNPDAQFNAAMVYLGMQRHGDAEALLQEAIRLAPRSFPFRLGFAEAAMKIWSQSQDSAVLERAYQSVLEALSLASTLVELEEALDELLRLGRALQKSGGVLKTELDRVADASSNVEFALAIRRFAGRIPANLARELELTF